MCECFRARVRRDTRAMSLPSSSIRFRVPGTALLLAQKRQHDRLAPAARRWPIVHNRGVPNSDQRAPNVVSLVVAALGLALFGGGLVLAWVSRAELAAVGPRTFTTLWHGGGGLALLYITASVPLGALLLAAGSARLFPTAASAYRVLLPLLGVQVVYFAYHSIAAFRYARVPFAAFHSAWRAARRIVLRVRLGLGAGAFAAGHQRTATGGLDARRRAVLLNVGLAGMRPRWAAGFGLYPELVRRQDGKSFLVGQALAVSIFNLLGFVLLLLAMRLEGGRSKD